MTERPDEMAAYAPANLHLLFQQAFNAGDPHALSVLYEMEAVLILGTQWVKGREAIRAAFETLLLPLSQISVETVHAVESPAGIALLHSRWTRYPGDPAEQVRHGFSTEVARRQASGNWLFLIDNPDTTA